MLDDGDADDDDDAMAELVSCDGSEDVGNDREGDRSGWDAARISGSLSELSKFKTRARQ